MESATYSLSANNSVFGELRRLITNKHIKGLVVGYPLDEQGRPMLHCNFIERFLSHMWS